MKTLPLIIDGHLDLSMNAMEWNRDLRQSIDTIRTLEKNLSDKPDRGNSTVCFPEMQKGNIGLCFATLIARYAKPDHPLGGWNSPEQAWGMAQAQLAWYEEMERQGELKMIKNKADLKIHLDQWTKEDYNSIGFVMTLEGADSIVTFDHLNLLYEKGLRAIGPAHYGPGTYAYGTDSEGSIGEKGKALLNEMDKLGIILDATHLCDISFWEAMDCYQGSVWASHSNCRSLVDHNRQFSDEQFKSFDRKKCSYWNAIGCLDDGPKLEERCSTPQNTQVTLDQMIDNMDHICQLAGNANHIAIGTDLDGGFGKEQGPSDVDTIADLQKLVPMLSKRGYSEEEIEGIFSGNWLRMLEKVL